MLRHEGSNRLTQIMLNDFDLLPNNSEVTADICIVGAGAAGLALAKRFSQTGLQVLVLEGGGLTYEGSSQNLYKAKDQGLPVQADVSRLRFFGGTTNHWQGQCTPLLPIDFEQRAWVADSGWPIAYDDLAPYYPMAQDILGLGTFDYSEKAWLEHMDGSSEFITETFKPFLVQLAPSPNLRFGPHLKEEVEAWDNVNVLYHANVVNVQANKESGDIEFVDIKSTEGNLGRATAGKFVLACGGIGNCHLMLNSNSAYSGGLGNETDNVGRYFMQHPHVDIAEIIPQGTDERERLRKISAAGTLPEEYNEAVAQVCMRLTADEQKRSQLLNHAFFCHSGAPLDSPAQTLIDLAKRVKNRQLPDDFWEQLKYLLKNIGELAKFVPVAIKKGVDPAIKELSGTDSILIQARMEHSPNKHSRLYLSDSTDALGMRTLETDWVLTKQDRQSIKLMAEKFGEEIGRLELGRVRFSKWFFSFDPDDESTSNWHPGMWGGFHHMGGTRMSDRPETGVVDKDCRVFGTNNLYIAGSSVFATSGNANPTLTLLALSYRLADHLLEG